MAAKRQTRMSGKKKSARPSRKQQVEALERYLERHAGLSAEEFLAQMDADSPLSAREKRLLKQESSEKAAAAGKGREELLLAGLRLASPGQPIALAERSDVKALIALGRERGGLTLDDLGALPVDIVDTELMEDLSTLLDEAGVSVD
ncbi:MAG: RNA polymerase sigma factor region1.1 domain-containing protein [Myxococcota bacterium]